MREKLKIYAKLATIKELSASNGDRINEINLYKAMATFADVYYDGKLFDPTQTDYGLSKDPSGISPHDYDICFIRNNEKEFWDFLNLKGPKRPKVLWTGSPYREKVFKHADGIVAYTDSWTKQLKNYDKNPQPGLYDGPIHVPKRILTFPQSISLEKFSSKKGHTITQEFRRSLNADFVIGHFGRLSESCYPYSLIHILPELKARYPDKNIKFIYSGLHAQRKIYKNNPLMIDIGNVRHEDMPYVISACDLISSNYRIASANWGGSRHVLEAAACGIPILTGNFAVRKEQLGVEYPLFWPWEKNEGRISSAAETKMLEHIISLIENPARGIQIGESLVERMNNYSTVKIGQRIEREINHLLGVI